MENTNRKSWFLAGSLIKTNKVVANYKISYMYMIMRGGWACDLVCCAGV